MHKELSKEPLSHPVKEGSPLPVEVIRLSESKESVFLSEETTLLFCRQGALCLSSFRQENFLLFENQVLLLLPGEEIRVYTKETSSFLAWRMNDIIPFFEYLDMEASGRLFEANNACMEALEANKHISGMFISLFSLIEEGFYSRDYVEGKFRELLILLRLFYSKELLSRFFNPLCGVDYSFKKKILQNHNQVRTVEELASCVNLSRSGFHQYFKKAVGKSPSRWMKEEKARHIFSELTLTSKSIKEIWIEQGFSSASYFNQFCWKYLGNSPSRIRKMEDLDK